MSQLNIPQAMQLALQHHQAGRLAEAEGLYRQILAQQPDHAEALHMLGVIARQAGRPDISADLIARAIRLIPGFAPAYLNLGVALGELQRFDEAIAAYQEAIRLMPDYAAAHCNLGSVLRSAGRLAEAITACRKAIQLDPGSAGAHYNLALAHSDAGQFDEAIASYSRAIELNPGFADAHNNLGTALRARGRIEEATAAYRKAAELAPNFALAHCNLGVVLRESGRLPEAITAFSKAAELKADFLEAYNLLGSTLLDSQRVQEAIAAFNRVIQLRPGTHEGYFNLGNALKEFGRMDEAVAAYARALELKPDLLQAHNNLGNTRKTQGYLDEAIAAYTRAIEIKPDYELAQSNLLYVLYFHPDSTAASILARHRQWAERFAEPLERQITAHANDRTPYRRLKIGYVSPDFRAHPVGRFLLPLLANHDRHRFEIHAYSDVRRPDSLTEVLRGHCDRWHETVGLADAALAERIRDDKIDLLIDLTLHLQGSRLFAFARKPAPVQVSWLGYPGTTGLKTIDYRLSDAYLDPPDADCDYLEPTIRMKSYWCYAPAHAALPVAPPPVLAAGHITFGCLGNFSKVSSLTLALWADVLRRVEHSRLLIHAHAGSHRDRVCRFFAEAGIDPARIEFARMQPMADYFREYGRIDIALDTTPYAGGTTTCDALWMGVPVVTLRGNTAVGRGGVSILNQVGLPNWIAQTPQQYGEIAARAAADVAALAEMRSSLRQRMADSPLADGRRFAADIEAIYRQIWEKWCAT